MDDSLTTHLFSLTLPDRTPIIELEYARDRLGNPVSRYDARPGARADSRDERYDYDGLRRLKDAERGSWNGSTFTLEAGSDRYDLDAVGNWNFSAVDEDGNASFTDPGEKTERTNTMANEVILLDIVQGAFDPLDPNVPPTTYVDVPLEIAWDHAGNMRTRDEHLGGGLTAEHVYTHDAWNRLVKVEAGTLDRAAYEYNGLGWRIRARSDDPLNPDGVYDEERVMAYDASWRMLEELIDDDLDVSAGFDRSAQQVWGLRYIDDAVVRRTNDDLTDDGSGVTYDGWFYYCTDVNFSPLAVLDDTALLVNRVRYRPYGFARHQYPGDLNEDGEVSSGEVTAITGAGTIAITSGSYDPNMDIDRNGIVDGTNDGALVSTKSALPEGWAAEDNDHAPISFAGVVDKSAGLLFGRSQATIWEYAVSTQRRVDSDFDVRGTIVPPMVPSCYLRPGLDEAWTHPLVQEQLLFIAIYCSGTPGSGLPTIFCGDQDAGQFCRGCLLACYSPGSNRTCLSDAFLNLTPGQMADYLIHELTHAIQNCRGSIPPNITCTDRIRLEHEAYCSQPSLRGTCEDAENGNGNAQACICYRTCLSASNAEGCGPLGDCWSRCMELVYDHCPGQDMPGSPCN